MLRSLFSISTACVALALLAIHLSRSVPATAQPHEMLDALLQGCETPCFIGIEPERTTYAEAVARLRAHGAITAVAPDARMDYYGNEHLPFHWQYADSTGGYTRHEGELVASYGLVYIVRLRLDAPLPDVWQALDQPPFATYNATGSGRAAHLSVTFGGTGLAGSPAHAWISGLVTCPLTFESWLYGRAHVIELRRRALIVQPHAATTNGALAMRSIRQRGGRC